MNKAKLAPERILSWVGIAALLALPIWLFVSVWFAKLFGGYEIWRAATSVLIAALTLTIFGYTLWKYPTEIKLFIRDKINWAVFALGLIMVITILTGDATWHAKAVGLVMDGRYLLAFLAFRLLVRIDSQFWHKTLEKLPRILTIIGVILAIAGLVQVTLIPRDFLTIFGYSFDGVAPYVSIDQGENLRAFATLAGPNNFANYLLITLFAALFMAWKSKGRSKVVYTSSAFVIILGLMASSSRAAFLAAAVSLVVLILSSVKISKKVIIYGLTSMAVIAGLFIVLLEVPIFRENILHIRDDRNGSHETSNDAHLSAFVDGVDQVISNPIGCGVGCSGPASYYSKKSIISENYYLQMAQQYSIVGALLFIFIMVLVLGRLAAAGKVGKLWFIVGIGLCFAALFAHTFTDEAVSVTWFAIAGSIIGIFNNSSVRFISNKIKDIN